MRTPAGDKQDEIDLFDDELFGIDDISFNSDQENSIGTVDKRDADAMDVSLKKGKLGEDDCAEIYAHGEAYEQDGVTKEARTVLLARVTASELTMFPLVSAWYRHSFLEPKYENISTFRILTDNDEPWSLPESISEFDELLGYLPVGFGRHAKYGLGFKWEYRLIPEAIAEVPGVTELIIQPGDVAQLDGHRFYLGLDRFSAIRRSIDSISDRASKRSLRDRRILAYNELLHSANPGQFQRQFAKVKAGEIYELVKLGGLAQKRSQDDRRAAASIILDDAEKIAEEQPSQLIKLKSVIELATLKGLIAKIEDMLQKNLTEAKWQAFFKECPFIIGLAFPHPVILMQEQAHVGGTTLNGSGQSIVDFLFVQRFTGNLALIEIKKPSTHLLETKPFRGDLYAPHKDLTSAMAQVLDQRSELLRNFASKMSQDSSLKDTHVSAVQCVVIAGKAPSTIEGKRSLDLFRHSSKDVVVVTFDELLAKLKEILRLITASTPADSQPLTDAAGALHPQNDDDQL